MLTLVLSLGLSLGAAAQNTVKGTVLDPAGEPVIGAAVQVVEASGSGTVTDIDGNYSIPVQVGQTLRFSSIGFVTKDVKVSSYANLNVTLEDDVTLLDDVIVIGYGTAKKSDLTGATSSMSGERIAKKNSPLLSSQLQGQMAGVQVTRGSGEANSGGTIRVRGITTTSTNDPLVIIDGIPGSINDVAAEDVKDIQVLKDAASASIYGARAAAGVILVTTKRAGQDTFKLSYNYEFGIDTPTEKPEWLGTQQWMIGINELLYNDGAKDLYSLYPKDLIDNFASYHAKDPDTYSDEDWTAGSFKKNTTHQRHSFTLTGGTKKLKSTFSFNYYDADGLLKTETTNNYKRFNIRSNTDYQINDWIHASADINLVHSITDYPHASSGYTTIAFQAPIYPIKFTDGEYSYGKSGENYPAVWEHGGNELSKGYTVTGKLQLDVTPVKGLTLSAVVAPQYYFGYGKSHTKKFQIEESAGVFKDAGGYAATNLTESRNNNNSMTTQFYANYKGDWGKHSLSAMVGYEGYTYYWENLSATRKNYLLSNFPYLDLGPSDQQFNSGTAGHNAYNSMFGRLIYSFAGKYLLQANVRRDWSSRFAKGYRGATFPSASFGWVMSEEPWFNSNFFNFVKLRASVGQLGNERIGEEFPYMALLSTGTSYLANTNGTMDLAQRAAQQDYAFEDISWETTTSYDLGVDLTMLDSRLRFSGDIYYKKTTDMLLTIGFPAYFGYNAPQSNGADMNTRGWEFEVSWNDHKGDFFYGASFNLSDYRSRMGYMADKQSISGNKITEEGSYYQEYYLYKNNGIILNEAAMLDASGKKIPTLSGQDKPGCIAYQDINGDGVISASGDRVRCGNSLPELLFGASFWANWKNLDFNVTLQGIGHQNAYWSWGVTPFHYQAYGCPQVIFDSHWSPLATDEENAKAKYPYFSADTSNIYANSDFYLFNGAYLRVKDITIGYTLPQNLTHKFKVDGLRFYASVNDLPALSFYPKGYDPEWNKSGQFIMTSFILGANLKF